MKKNGFTLIELLGVVVILGVLSVLIVPKVISSISDSKKNSYKISINNLITALNTIAVDKKATLTPFNGCSINFSNGANDCTDLKYSGELPDGGYIMVDTDGNVNGSIIYDDSRYEVRNGDISEFYNDYEFAFDYTGNEQLFIVISDGYYKLETWGAQGGTANSTYIGGKGGYASETLYMNSDSKMYINVGGMGKTCETPSSLCAGGYNGGGSGKAYSDSVSVSAGGGGATHIASSAGLLSDLKNNRNSVLIVAAGGGGGHYTNSVNGGIGGAGGGISGLAPTDTLRDTKEYRLSVPATSSSAACSVDNKNCGDFGFGGNSDNSSYHGAAGSGGGAGYYGGSGANIGPGAGGSSYTLSTAINVSNISGTGSMPTHDGNGTMTGNSGNGYVRITYLGESL